MILVTGGTGLVGAHLVMELVQEEKKVRATYRNKDKIEAVRRIFSNYHENSNDLFKRIEWVKADITNIPSLKKAFEGISKVYHTSALVSFDPKDDKKLLRTNIEGTANVVNISIGKKVDKLCFVSSIAALGTSVNSNPINEEKEWTETATTMYAISKHHAEMEVWRASQEGIPVAVVNPGIIVAAGFWKRSSGSFFSQAYRAPNFYLPSGTGFVGVKDVVSAMMGLMKSSIHNQRYILVSENWTYKKFSYLLAKGLNKPLPKKAIKPWMLVFFWRLDWLRANILGKRRRLSKEVAQLFKTQDFYDGSKIERDLNFTYGNLENTVKECCAIFLREQED